MKLKKNQYIAIGVAIILLAAIIILAIRVKTTCDESKIVAGACLDSNNQVVTGVSSQADCNGATDGTWLSGEHCYNFGTGGKIQGEVSLKTGGMTGAICAKYPKSYVYFADGVCLGADGDPIAGITQSADCGSKGTWDANYKVMPAGC